LEVVLQTLEILKEYNRKKLSNFPEINYSNLYKKIHNNFYFEFVNENEKILFSPYYTHLRGETIPELMNFISKNNPFFDSMKKFIINSLFVYSALIEENSYFLTNPQSIIISRITHHKDSEFEIKFYTHYEEELQNYYNDKIYIGRDLINLKQFERKYLGLKIFFLSLIEQNKKIQERAKHKLRYYNDYNKPYLKEIDYSVKETVSDAMDRIELFPETMICNISTVKLIETLDNILYLLNLMTELRDFTMEFENKLRLRKESSFAKYMTKFSMDLKDGRRYLRKLSTQMHLRISNFPITKC
jgi:hypothetical protein